MTNDGVIKAWINRETAITANGAFSTNGKDLFSYRLKIGTVNQDGTYIVYDYRGGYSKTTTKHVNMATKIGFLVDAPK